MIRDAQVEVTCDGRGCCESVSVELHYVYSSYSGRRGSYDSEDRAVERSLEKDHDWLVEDGKHYCPECVAYGHDGEGVRNEPLQSHGSDK